MFGHPLVRVAVGGLESVDTHARLGQQCRVEPAQSRTLRQVHQALVEIEVGLTDTGVVLLRARHGHLLGDPQQLLTSVHRVMAEDLFGRRPFDGGPGDIHVVDILHRHVDDEQTPVANRDQQTFLGQPLHPLPQRPTTHAELPGQLCLTELLAGLEVSLADRGAQFVGDDARCRLTLQRFDGATYSIHAEPVRNSDPIAGRLGTGPSSRNPSHTVTWLAVSTGLAAASSSSSSQASECIAVSGTSTASAPPSAPSCVTPATRASTASLSRVPTSAAVMMSWLTMVVTSIPPWVRKSRKLAATSSGYDAATATDSSPRARTALTKAMEVDDAGRPVVAAISWTCSRAPSHPKTKLPEVQAHIIESGCSVASTRAPSCNRVWLPRSSSASMRCAS